jgi:membrane-bound lytic murein transglycosylase
VEDQINKLGSIREKVSSIKENYDKKFQDLQTQFKEIENLFITGYFEQQTLGDLKNSK